jgi:hypothetical protein
MDMENRFIYGLIDPQTKELRYIGQTKIGMKRVLSEHSAHCRSWIRKLKRAGLKPEVIILERPEDLNQAERNWIAFGRALGCPLTNIADGGEGNCLKGPANGFYGKKHDEETRKRMSAAKKGRPQPNVSLAKKGKVVSPMKGKKHKPESIEKLKKNHVGMKGKKYVCSDERKRILSEAAKRRWQRQREQNGK